MHEKAVDDYSDRFTDGALPEACVIDVLRARLICTLPAQLLALLELVVGTTDTPLSLEVALPDGRRASVTLRCVRLKHKFGSSLDPTHFRYSIANLRVEVQFAGEATPALSTFVEMQLHAKPIIEYNEASHAHAHYDFMRAKLAAQYETQLDDVLCRILAVFEACAGNPVLLSMLIVIIGEGGEEAVLPRTKLELYDLATAATVRRYLREHPMPSSAAKGSTASVAEEATRVLDVLRRVGAANVLDEMVERRVFSDADALAALGGGDNVAEAAKRVALWRELRRRGEHGVALVKVLDAGQPVGSGDQSSSADSSVELQFKHKSFQEAFAVRTLIDDTAVQQRAFGTSSLLARRLNSATFANAADIGGELLGNALLGNRDDWDFTKGDRACIHSHACRCTPHPCALERSTCIHGCCIH